MTLGTSGGDGARAGTRGSAEIAAGLTLMEIDASPGGYQQPSTGGSLRGRSHSDLSSQNTYSYDDGTYSLSEDERD